MTEFDSAGVPAGPVLDIEQMTNDPQALHREMVTEVPHAQLGQVKTLGSPIKLAATPTTVRRGAPVLGQHTKEVLLGLGYDNDEIAKLANEGAIIVADTK